MFATAAPAKGHGHDAVDQAKIDHLLSNPEVNADSVQDRDPKNLLPVSCDPPELAVQNGPSKVDVHNRMKEFMEPRLRSSLLGKISQGLQNQLCFPSYGCQLIRYKGFGI